MNQANAKDSPTRTNKAASPSRGPSSRGPNQRQRIVELLRARGAAGITTGDFLRMPIARYSSRLKELRTQGYVIRTERITESKFRYTLVSEPSVLKSISTYEPKKSAGVTPSLFAEVGR